MRVDGFLRTPVRASHQDRLLDLSIREVDPVGDPDAVSPYPQTLEIAFQRGAAVTEVQVVPMWGGLLGFRPDPGVAAPVDPTKVTPANFDAWNATGELVLRTFFPIATELTASFAKHIPLVDPAPDTVVYSKVVLTKEFLFTTLPALHKYEFVQNGVKVLITDPLFHQKRTIAFLLGRTKVFCRHSDSDPALDQATLPMPGILLAPVGSETILRLTAATVAPEALIANWFLEVPEYDGVSGEDLVLAPLQSVSEQMSNPRHPGHSVIPLRLVFQIAPPQAFASDEPATTPLRVALSQALPNTETYRRVEIVRLPVPGLPATSSPQRPYPCYKVCWTAFGAPVRELRLPLSGRAYLPMGETAYTFWVINRSADSTVVTAGDQFLLSRPAVLPPHVIGAPQPIVALDVSGLPVINLFASLVEFDSAYVWVGYVATAAGRAPLKATAQANWNVKVLDWYIDAPKAPPRAARVSFSGLYGMFRESAGRHGLAPEFLQVIFFGEAGGVVIDAQAVFNPAQAISCFGFLGLDLILYRTGNLRPLDPPIPPEVPAANLGERAEYNFNLVTNGYVDQATSARLSWSGTVTRMEGGMTRTLQTGDVAGWSAAIELMAAELHARLAEMQEYCNTHVPPIPVDSEIKRQYLAYVRFNTNPTNARKHADDLENRVKRWVGAPPPPPGNQDARFNALQRIAVTEWHVAAGTYR